MKGLWLIISTIASFIDESFTEQNNNPTRTRDVVYSDRVIGRYARFNETIFWYLLLHNYNAEFTMFDLGRTIENRPLRVLRMTTRRGLENLPAIFVESTIHGSEWMAAAATNYVIHTMFRRYKAGVPRYVNALNKYTFYFMTHANPDGYDMTFGQGPFVRMWRKNKRVNPGTTCKGVDLNRNWNVSFGEGRGTSNNPCSMVYHGSSAFSENETNTLQFLLRANIGVGRLALYLAVHSFGQTILLPYAHTTKKPRKYCEMERAATYASEAIRNATGANYTVLHAPARKGKTTSGTSTDWALQYMRANYSYIFETRPTKKQARTMMRRRGRGFIWRSSDIRPSGQDLLTALMALVDTMNTN